MIEGSDREALRRANARLAAAEADLLPALQRALRKVIVETIRDVGLPSQAEADAALTAATFFRPDRLQRLIARWRNEVDTYLMPRLKRLFDATAKHVMQSLDPNLPPAMLKNVRDLRAIAALDEIRNRLYGVGDTLFREAAEALQTSRALGEGHDKAAARIAKVLDVSEARAKVISRTESAQVLNAADQAVSEELVDAGIAHSKEWLATMTGPSRHRTRPSHRKVDGTIVRVGEPFIVGPTKSKLMYPGDPSGPPEEVIQCRCTTLLHLVEDAEEELDELAMVAATFDESAHSRDETGKFASGGGSGSAATKKTGSSRPKKKEPPKMTKAQRERALVDAILDALDDILPKLSSKQVKALVERIKDLAHAFIEGQSRASEGGGGGSKKGGSKGDGGPSGDGGRKDAGGGSGKDSKDGGKDKSGSLNNGLPAGIAGIVEGIRRLLKEVDKDPAVPDGAKRKLRRSMNKLGTGGRGPALTAAAWTESLHPRGLDGRFIDVTMSFGNKWLKITDNDSGLTTTVPKGQRQVVHDYLSGSIPADRVVSGRKWAQVKDAEGGTIAWIPNGMVDTLKALDRDGHFTDGPPEAAPEPEQAPEPVAAPNPAPQMSAMFESRYNVTPENLAVREAFRANIVDRINDALEGTGLVFVETPRDDTRPGWFYFEGEMFDEAGGLVGDIRRNFVLTESPDGGAPGYVVNNVLFKLAERAQGKGIATRIAAALEPLYAESGVEEIHVHANIDVGGYTWAKQGFGWDPEKTSYSGLIYRVQRVAETEGATPEQREQLNRLAISITDDPATWPTPYDLAMFGYTEGADTWLGKRAMLTQDWYGVKHLR